MRQNSLTNPGVLYNRELSGMYDDVKVVADNIDGLIAIGESDLIGLATEELESIVDVAEAAELIENLEFSAKTLLPGQNATAILEDSLVTIGVPRGQTGMAGANGLTPILNINELNGILTVEVVGYDNTINSEYSEEV